MASLPPPIIDQGSALALARQYVRKVEAAGFPIDAAYLYGSYAKGKQRPYSDIDVAVVSPRFSGVRFDDRRQIFSLRADVSIFIEPMPFTPDKFADWHPLVHEIKTTGIALK